MDDVTIPVIRYLLEKDQNLIYIRPSMTGNVAVEKIRTLVNSYPQYQFIVIRLNASIETLKTRVIERKDPYRIQTAEKLDEYFASKTLSDIPGEHVVETDGLTAQMVTERITEIVNIPTTARG